VLKPSVKENDRGVKELKGEFGGRGCAIVNEPVILQRGGQKLTSLVGKPTRVPSVTSKAPPE
jgi:hypothetical protein